MKKTVLVLVLAVFLIASIAPAAAAGGRVYGFRSHGHHSHYHSSGDQFWFGLGMGVLTGAIVSSFYYAPPPPPPAVIYYPPAAVVVNEAPVTVQPRRFGTAPLPAYGQVVVSAAELNMRSGPGLDRAVTGQVRKGDVLSVIDSIPDWFYVREPNGRYGWVMDRYTRPTQPLG